MVSNIVVVSAKKLLPADAKRLFFSLEPKEYIDTHTLAPCQSARLTHLLLRRAGTHLERISVVLLHEKHRRTGDILHVSTPRQAATPPVVAVAVAMHRGDR